MTLQVLRSTLETKLKTWADANNLPVAYEGVPYTKPDTAWVDCFIIPATTMNKTVSAARKTYYGIFQVNIYVKDGTGNRTIEALGQSLIDAFPVVPKVGAVSVEATPSYTQPILEGVWRILPVRIKYRYETY